MNQSAEESTKKYGETLSFPLLSDPSREALRFLMEHPLIPDYHRVTRELAERMIDVVEGAKVSFPQTLSLPLGLRLEVEYQDEARLLIIYSFMDGVRVSKDSFFFPLTFQIEKGEVNVSEEIVHMLQTEGLLLERILRLEVDGVACRNTLPASVSVHVAVCQIAWRQHFFRFDCLGDVLLQRAGLAEAKKIGDIQVFTMGSHRHPKTNVPVGWLYGLPQE